MRRFALIGFLALAALLGGSSGAGAAVTIGQTEGTLGSCTDGFDWVAAVTPSGSSYVVPEVGTITSWTTNAGGRTGDQLAMKIFRKVGDPATYQVVGHAGPQTLTLPGQNTFTASVPVRPGDVLGFHTGTNNQNCSLEGVIGASIHYFGGDLADGASDSFFEDTGYLLNIAATLDPDNTFTIGPLTGNRKKGTATATLTVPNPGTVAVGGKGVKGVSASQATSSGSIAAPGTVKVPIRAKGKKKRTLNATGKVKLKAKITYTPTGGTARTAPLKVKLKKNL